MKESQSAGILGNRAFFNLSAYGRMIGCALISLLIRALAWSPLLALWSTAAGMPVKWIAVFCPVLLVTLVLPMRFSFARAIMKHARGDAFSLPRALRLTRYREKLTASLRHALRVLCWGLPFLLTLGWVYYLVVAMDAFMAIRTLTALGDGVVSVLSGVCNFFAGIFGGGVQWDGGFTEGVYAVCAIAALSLLVLLWGVWRCSAYRYLWASEPSKTLRSRIKLTAALRGQRGRQLVCGLYNLFLWLPTLFFVSLFALSVRSRISDFVTTVFESKSVQPISFSLGEALLFVVALLIHLLILPVRRSVTANFVASVAKAGAQGRRSAGSAQSLPGR